MFSPQKRILCVDDDPDTCELLQIIFTSYQFKAVRTICDGWKSARTEPFDLYILDNWLPDGSGVDLCRQIRTIDPSVPIVFLSAAAYESDHREAIGVGATIYMDKPVDPFNLEAKITQLVDQAEAYSLEARLTEIDAMREAIADHVQELARKSSKARDRLAIANDHLLRVQAYRTFTASGGTRSYFDRFWPEVLREID
jgi:DNA-binding response OmpR family regulator